MERQWLLLWRGSGSDLVELNWRRRRRCILLPSSLPFAPLPDTGIYPNMVGPAVDRSSDWDGRSGGGISSSGGGSSRKRSDWYSRHRYRFISNGNGSRVLGINRNSMEPAALEASVGGVGTSSAVGMKIHPALVTPVLVLWHKWKVPTLEAGAE